MTAPVIALSGIVNRFGERVIHDGIDLEVRRGEILGLVGASGSGKTVLMNCMIGLRVPTAGEVRVFGEPLTGPARERRRHMRHRTGVLFQQGALFTALTVAENVGFPIRELHSVPPAVERRLVNLRLQAVGLAVEDGDKLPAELSGGMVKRAALARALALDPELLFLDEPTSGLDPVSARSFVKLIRDMHASYGLTVVMVTHDIDTMAALSDRVAVLADQRLVAVDTLDQVVQTDHPFVKAFFRVYRGESARNHAKHQGGT